MASVIVNEKGELYRGFETEKARPVWVRNMHDDCVMEDAMADQVIRQLTQLGFTKFVKRDADGVKKKWVPTDLDASAA